MQLRKLKHQLMESAWLLGICEDGYDGLKAGHIQWIDNGKYSDSKWFADPFILEYDDEKIVLLVEEFDYKIHYGRLARLIVDRKKWKVIDCRIILDNATHVSFPMIIEERGKIYVCPENYRSGAFNLYEYDRETERLTFIKPIVREQLTDATIWKYGDAYYVFSTCIPTPNGKVLTIWRADSLMGNFIKEQEITFREKIARNAGKIFEHGDVFIRPTQECNYSYGHALTFQRIDVDEKGQFCFSECNRIESIHSTYSRGIHTFNQHTNGMAVIDVKGWRYPFAGRVLNTLDNILIKIQVKSRYIPQ